MSLTRDLAARGISPTSPPAERAAAVVRALPLRVAGNGAEDPGEALARGWMEGLAEAAGVLTAVSGWPARPGMAFATRWPCLVHEDVLVAPAVPVPVATEAGPEVAGPDAAYRSRRGVVWREAGGVERPLLASDVACEPSVGAPCDLVWFGTGERYLVRDAQLEISDLFAELSLPATTARLEHLLVRGRRLAPSLLDGLAVAAGDGPASLVVRRSRALLRSGRPGPARLLGARADVGGVTASGDRLEARLEAGGSAIFVVSEHPGGWRLQLVAGAYPLPAIALTEEDQHMAYEVTLGPDLDPLRPGLRARLAFDLTSDLVVCAG